MAKRRAMAKSLDPAELDYLELSDSTTVLKGNAAPSLGGSCSSPEQLDSDTSPCEREWSRCVCASPEPLALETSPCKKPKNDVIEGIAKMTEEKEERLQKFMVEQQVLMAKMNEDKEERFQKFMVEQQVLMAKMNEEKEERLQKFMVEQQVVMAKMNEEKEERLQKFMVEQQVVMAKIIVDAVKDAVGRRLDNPAE